LSLLLRSGLFVLIIFSSTLLRAAFGFGNALIAMPLLVLLLGINTATPLVALVAIVTALVMLIRERQALKLKDTSLLLLASFGGIPLGIYFFRTLPEHLVAGLLGLILIFYGLFNLTGFKLPVIQRPWLALPFGFLAGLLGGAYNTNGPPVVIFASLRGWDKRTFRANLQGYFLITGLGIAFSHGLSGLWTWEVIYYLLISLPLIFLTVLLGEKITRDLTYESYFKGVNLVLIFLGLFLLI
jgi:uncharacterized membrane protein YfcA